jgi:TPR repeat protein
MCRLCSLLLFVLCLLQTSWIHAETRAEMAQRLKMQGYRAYYGKGQGADLVRALAFYRQAAELDDAEAQYVYGAMLYQGQGTDPDKRSGFKWLLKAAEQGEVSPESLAIIGAMYLRGSTVPQNYLQAKKWLTQAAGQGNRAAQNDLAYLYYNGLGGERDYRKALELYEQAALQGDPMAQANTGLMYATGSGTETDRARGYAWYSLAASRGNAIAAMNRNNLMMEMSWEELNRAQAISLELYRQVEKMAEPKMIAPEPPQE